MWINIIVNSYKGKIVEDFKNHYEWSRSVSRNKIEIPKKINYRSKKKPNIILAVKHGKTYIPNILETIKQFDPELFIELGTFQGGLTLIIHEEFPALKIYSFDHINRLSSSRKKSLFDKFVTFYIQDLINFPNKFLIDFLVANKSVKKILYCDNGNKTYEINTYSKYLSVGDVIGCHDWFVEVNPEDVKDSLENFVPYKLDLWKNSHLLSRFWIKVK